MDSLKQSIQSINKNRKQEQMNFKQYSQQTKQEIGDLSNQNLLLRQKCHELDSQVFNPFLSPFLLFLPFRWMCLSAKCSRRGWIQQRLTFPDIQEYSFLYYLWTQKMNSIVYYLEDRDLT